jgi:hypothetical protein
LSTYTHSLITKSLKSSMKSFYFLSWFYRNKIFLYQVNNICTYNRIGEYKKTWSVYIVYLIWEIMLTESKKSRQLTYNVNVILFLFHRSRRKHSTIDDCCLRLPSFRVMTSYFFMPIKKEKCTSILVIYNFRWNEFKKARGRNLIIGYFRKKKKE